MAQTYKFGNGTWATKKGSTLAYSDTNNAFKPLPFSFERNSIATRVNKEGLIEVVGNDIPRIDYTDSSEGALLLENSSTNLITYSEDFSQSYWIKTNSLIESNNIISPDGTLNGAKLNENTVSNTNFRLRSGSAATTGTNTLSIFAKAGERNWIKLRENAQTGVYAFFNLQDGTIGQSTADDVFMEYYGNGWYKLSITDVLTSASIDVRIAIADGVDTYNGVIGNGVYVWGFQIEQNSVASSYIPTNGSTVQRAAETCNESGNSEVFNDSEGVLFADISSLDNSQIYKLISISDGTNNNRVTLGYNNSAINKFYFQLKANSSSIWSLNIEKNINVSKIAFKYKSGLQSVFVNGFEVVNRTDAFTFSSNLSDLSFFEQGTTNPFYGKTKEIAYYDTILTDAELEYLTSYRSLNEMVTELNLNAL